MVFNFFKSIFGEDGVLFNLGQGDRILGTCRPLCGFANVIVAFCMVTFQSCQFMDLLTRGTDLELFGFFLYPVRFISA